MKPLSSMLTSHAYGTASDIKWNKDPYEAQAYSDKSWGHVHIELKVDTENLSKELGDKIWKLGNFKKVISKKPKKKIDPFKFAVHLQEQFHEQDISGSEYEWMKLKPSEWYAYTLCGGLPDDFLERWGL